MARIKCSFVLSGGSLNPSEVSRLVDINPTLAWRTGDYIAPSKRQRKDNGWKLSVEETSSEVLEEVFMKLMHILEPARTAFRTIVEQVGCEAEFSCAIYLGGCDAVPSIHLDSDIIGMVHAYKADLDIDLYPNPAE